MANRLPFRHGHTLRRDAVLCATLAAIVMGAASLVTRELPAACAGKGGRFNIAYSGC